MILVANEFGLSKGDFDINGDGAVNILDLILVAAHLAESPTHSALVNPDMVRAWIDLTHTVDNVSFTLKEGIVNLERLLTALLPDETILLQNYPNPFNPETWIPYHLSTDADVQILIYDMTGVLVHRLDVGYQLAGDYTDRTKAVYWDGLNNFGERVVNGIYFYQLRTGDFSQMRKMVILK